MRRHLCDACRALSDWKRKPRDQPRHREWRLRTVYGITVQDYDDMLVKQNGVCAICQKKCSTGQRLAVDHDHTTKRVRGLLCGRCNQVVGRMEDNPEFFQRAAEYLR